MIYLSSAMYWYLHVHADVAAKLYSFKGHSTFNMLTC